ncbi:MAG TPA: glycosyltransferase [Acidimicrobiia bacterium]|jgi:GT2 family glycosyltransferase/glycosyltransferase involved in cell wall biosynthesis/predicted SAM-dependent methyltransferase
MKVNLGCGTSYLDGWVNVDAYPGVRADVYMEAFDFVRQHGAEIDELYMGHFLEHLLPASAVALLSLVADELPEGSRVSAVVPDMRAIFAAYDAGEISNDDLNVRYVYSYEQPSHHVWCYDADSLVAAFERAGYTDVRPIDPLTWEPVFWKEGPESRWQCGVVALTPPSAAAARPVPDVVIGTDDPLPVSTDEALLNRIRRLRDEVEDLRTSGPPAGEPAGGPPPAPAPAANGLADPAPRAGEPSLFDRLPAPLVPTARRLAPEGSPQRRLARFGVETARIGRQSLERVRYEWIRTGLRSPDVPTYDRWRHDHDATAAQLARQRRLSSTAAHPIGIHVVVGHDGHVAGLERTLRSLTKQSWTHWTATVVGDASAAAVVAAVGDRRIGVRTTELQELDDVVNAVVADVAPRDFVAFVEPGDVLAADWAFEIADHGDRDPLVDLVYWDDDVIDARGHRVDPRFRPAWSPELLLGANYLGASFALRNRRITAVAGVPGGCGDARSWELLLRCDLSGDRVARVPRVLAHLTARPDLSPAASMGTVQRHLDRLGDRASLTFERGTVRVRWEVETWPHVTVVIPTRHNRPLVVNCLRDLARTDYPSFDVVVVDNGQRTDENERWYAEQFPALDLRVTWWDRPFNYSAVNNAGAALARGDVLLFLNDDTEMPDPEWMRELVSWAARPEIGIVGAQLIGPDGEIQHGGVILGMHGFADHLFQGMPRDAASLVGPTAWYRNVLSNTGACIALRRELFERLGGFDERFVLCGSDVVLGLDAVLHGLRNLCTPFAGVRHLESATRGKGIVPSADFFASHWRYQYWVSAGDPYFSPNLSLNSPEPVLRSRFELTPAERAAPVLGRTPRVFRMQSDAEEATMLATTFRAVDADARSVEALHQRNAAPFAPRTVAWFLPDIDSPFYGGVNTVLRLASYLARAHEVENRFVFWSAPNEPYLRSAIAAAFPELAEAPIAFHDASTGALEALPEADVAVATLWATAYSVAQFAGARRKFYMIQDFEPMFYPAGTLYALAEESYRLGLYGLCNTAHMLRLYEDRYGGRGTSFEPAVDTTLFHAHGRRDDRTLDDVATVFVYARPGHWRNCAELAFLALQELKQRLGDRVRIVTAGSWATPDDVGTGIEHLGLLDYRALGDFYRACDVGVALTVSEHPSYLPLELMACGVPVVAFDNPAGHWILRDGENALLARRTVDSLRDAIERIVLDPELGRALGRNGVRSIAEHHASWDGAFAEVYAYLGDPERKERPRG